jgi:hypothetical protein
MLTNAERIQSRAPKKPELSPSNHKLNNKPEHPKTAADTKNRIKKTDRRRIFWSFSY